MSRPLLSVVVPVYNVQDYLKDAVASIRRQSYTNLEVILVDDGSTDASGDLCDEFAYRDPRIRVLHQRNGGLSNARNNGAIQATGEMLTFMDSDDLLFDDSYERMVGTITDTGSEFVSGNVQRFNRRRGWQAWNQSASHTADRFRTNIIKHPELVFDAVAWNKVFRRDFYEKAKINFPEGKLYEDMVPMYRAYKAAKSVDVLHDPTYRWRVREEKNSISQRRAEYQNLADKIEMVDTIYRDLRLRRQNSLRDPFFRKVLEGDLWLYVENVSESGSTQFDQLLAATVRRYWRAAPISAKRVLQQQRRVLYQALSNGHPELIQPILSWYREHGDDLPVVHRRNKVYLDTKSVPSNWPRLSLEDRSLEVETQLTAGVTDIIFDPATSSLRIGGWAFVTLWPAAAQQTRVWLRDPTNDRRVQVPVVKTGLPSPTAAQKSRDRQHDVSSVGFEARIEGSSLAQLAGSSRRTKDWQVEIEVQTPESARRSEVTNFTRGGSISAIVPRFVADDVQIVPVAQPGEALYLAVRRPFLIVDHVERQGRTVTIDVKTLADETLGAKGKHVLQLKEDQLRRTLTLDAEQIETGRWRVSFDLPEVPGERYVMWKLSGVTAGKSRRAAWGNRACPITAPDSPGISIRPSVGGWLVITESARALEVTSAALSPDVQALAIEASITPEPGTVELALARDDDRSPRWQAAEVDGSNASITFDLTTEDWYGTSRPWRPGTYTLRARRVPPVRGDQRKPVATSPLFVTVTSEATQPMLHDVTGPMVTGRLHRSGGHDLKLQLETPIAPQDRGPYAKYRGLSRFGEGAIVEPENSVFMRVNAGYGANDSALYLQREIERRGLNWTVYWGVRNMSVQVPPGGIALVDGQQAWYEKLARSRLVINNYGGIWRYPHHPHQLYLQTWHGTPYKSIGRSEVRHQGGSASDYSRVTRESAEWDFLLSPNPYCSQIFPREFDYSGPLLATGMPRNDFAATATETDQEEIRERLGIPLNAKVVLYAPTFRDNQRKGLNSAMYRGLDLDALRRRLGDGWIILVRAHSFTERTSDRTATSDQIVDVTDVPDIAELYVAANACITDYSSAMFDFSVTGKPLYYFTPDLEEYVRNRSTYFDLKDVAPSALHRDVDSLAEDVADLNGYNARYGYRYQAFQQSFVPWDDGKASARVLDTILAEIETRG